MRKLSHIFVAASFAALVATPSAATVTVWDMTCDESQVKNGPEVDGSTDSTATGAAQVRYDDADNRLFYDISWDGLNFDLSKLHVHGPADSENSNGAHIFNVYADAPNIPGDVNLTTDRVVRDEDLFEILTGGCGVPGSWNEEEAVQIMRNEEAYVNIHSTGFPGGEIRCHFVHLIDREPQSKDQQKCINGFNKQFAKIASAEGKQICKCFKGASKGSLGETVDACIVPGAGSKVAKSQSKTSDVANGVCQVDAPDFGATDAPTINTTAVSVSQDSIFAIFGVTLDGVIQDKDSGGGCQLAVAKAAKKCLDTRVKEFNSCKKAGLQGKDSVTTVDALGLELCDGEDSKGKIAKACDAESGKLKLAVDKKCGGQDLAALFPGCNEADPADLASCVSDAVESELCLALNVVDDLNMDCNALDDPALEGNCVGGP